MRRSLADQPRLWRSRPADPAAPAARAVPMQCRIGSAPGSGIRRGAAETLMFRSGSKRRQD